MLRHAKVLPYHHKDRVCNKFETIYNGRGRDSSVSIATHYWLDVPGIESRFGRDFPHPSRPALGPTQPHIQWVPRLSRGQSGRGVALTIHPI
jgi:hypothetical protein